MIHPQVRQLMTHLATLEHSLERAVRMARLHPTSLAHAAAACANTELLQAMAFSVASELTSTIFGLNPRVGGAGVPGAAPSGVTVQGQGLLTHVAGSPQFQGWVTEHLRMQLAAKHARQAMMQAQHALEPRLALNRRQLLKRAAVQHQASLRARDDTDIGGRGEASGWLRGAAPGAMQATAGAAQDMAGATDLVGPTAADRREAAHFWARAARAAGRPPRVALATALMHGHLLQPDQELLAAMSPGAGLDVPFASWEEAFSWAVAVSSTLQIPDAAHEARAADMLLYHLPRICALAACEQDTGKPFNHTVVGPSSGEPLGWLECPMCPARPASDLVFGERHSQDIPADTATGRPGWKHMGLDDMADKLRGFCRKVLPLDAKLLAQHAGTLVEVLENAAQSLREGTGAPAVAESASKAAELALSLPQAPEPAKPNAK